MASSSAAAPCSSVGLAAAWLISANGPGAGKIGTLNAPTVVAGAPSDTSTLLPGGTAAGTFSVTNTNDVPLTVTGTAASGTGAAAQTTGLTQFTQCANAVSTADPVSVVTQTGLTGITVPAKATTTVTVPGTFKLANSAPSDCQGQTFSKPVALSFSAGS